MGVLGVRAASALRGRQSRRRGIRTARGELLDLAGEFAPHPVQGIEQLGSRAFCRRRAEDGFRVLEAGTPPERDVAKTKYSEQADGCFHAASTEYSEHPRIVGKVR